MPGEIALKLDKNILKKIEKPKTIICVTGTTGKTSICNTLTEIYKAAGINVKSNIKGSNLKFGVTSLFLENCTLTGKIKTDTFIIEIDERYVKEIFKDFKPNYFIINNLSRDQLARNGHFDLVWKEINDSLSSDIHLILNADDPLIVKFAINHKGKVSYYGMRKNKLSTEKASSILDLAYCPICHHKLIFDYYHYCNIGSFYCPNNDFKRPIVELEAILKDNNSFEIDGQTIKMNNDAIYNVYNLAASYVTAYVNGLDKKTIVQALNKLSLKVKRLDTLNIFSYHTKCEEKRLINESVMKCNFIGVPIIGFQNRSTSLFDNEYPLFNVIKGIGSSPNSSNEGIKYQNFYGTYLLGPILIRNPKLLTYLVKELIISYDNKFEFKEFNLKLNEEAYESFINNFYQNIN